MHYFLTPEFHRNLWLKFSPFKFLAVPAILLIMTVITNNAANTQPYQSLMSWSLSGYFFVVILWGTFEAAGALQDEVKGRTWDFQKMSSITPTQLAFGKLFGATSYIWYVGITLLCVFAYSYSQYTPRNMDVTVPTLEVYGVTLLLLLCGVMGHTVAFISSFTDMHSAKNKQGRLYVPSSISAFIAGTIASGWIYFNYVMPGIRFSARNRTLFDNPELVKWFGWDIGYGTFIFASLLFFLSWALIAVYRTARAELMYPLTPAAWGAAVLTICTYLAGFMRAGTDIYLMQMSFFFFCMTVALSYCVMFIEASDLEKYKRFMFHWKKQNTARMFQNMPKWIATLLFVPLFYVLTLAACVMTGQGTEIFLSEFSMLTTIILFAVRDGLVIHGVHMGAPVRYIRFYIITYYTLAYVLLPLLHFTFISFNHSHAKYTSGFMKFFEASTPDGTSWNKFDHALAFYYPTGFTNVIVSLTPILLQVAAACIWLLHRRKQLLSAA